MNYSNAYEDFITELEDIYGTGCVTPAIIARHRVNAIKEKYAEVNDAAKTFARENKLCALSGTGTPAQVRWAQSIRAERFQSKLFTKAQEVIMAQIGDATWWIETRGLSAARFGQTLKSAEVSKIVKSTETKALEAKVKRSAKGAQKKAGVAVENGKRL